MALRLEVGVLSSLQFIFFLLLAAITSSVYSQGGCVDCNAIGTASCNDSVGQCVCLPGVAGPRCSTCLPGYTNFSAQGCRQECRCNATGSLGAGCSEEGVCQCHSRAAGKQCDVCLFGFHEFSRGCTPCPPCFNGVSLEFNTASELYQTLLSQLNFTLEGGTVGVSPALLARISQYRELLELLFQRVNNASMWEQRLTYEEANFSELSSSLRDQVNRFLANLTTAEAELAGLVERQNISQKIYNGLLQDVGSLRMVVEQELRKLLEEAALLNRDLLDKLRSLLQASSGANGISLGLQEQANYLHEQILIALSAASSSLRRLYSISVIQNSTLGIVKNIEVSLASLEDLSAVGQEGLSNASNTVPMAFAEASRVLMDVFSISSLDLNLNASSEDLEGLDVEVHGVRESVDEVSFFLEDLQNEFFSINNSAVLLLLDNERLNNEAILLLKRSEDALVLADKSTTEGNAIIAVAQELLRQLQNRFNDMGGLVDGLTGVIANVVRAERLSGMATRETIQVAAEVRQVATIIGTSMDLVEQASRRLNETLRLAIQVNTAASQLQNDSSVLTNETAELAQDISMATDEVDKLEQAVGVDRDAIAAVVATANETIGLADGIGQRIEIVNRIIVDLMRELNETLPLPPGRFQEVQPVLIFLEKMADLNQVQVDAISIEIQRLQESTHELRLSYTSLRQHRDLLQEILDNVEPLDCTNQFA